MPERVHQRLDSGAQPEVVIREKQAVTTKGEAFKSDKSKQRKKRVSFVDSVDIKDEERDPSNSQFSSKRRKLSHESPNALCKHGKNPSSAPSLDPPNPFYSSTSIPSTPRRGAQSSLTARSLALWPARKQLPVWAHSRAIRDSLRQKDVLIISGATGSGKSTQVPQILLTEPWCQPVGRIAVTEPRRVAAISLARRVAEEMGTPLGSGGKVGYSVRFDSCVGKALRVKFLTEGMLLREILRDPWLSEYDAVVVDEVHERGVGVDLVLGFLRRIVEGQGEGRWGERLKVVVMSATADTERLRRFFGGESKVATTNGAENGTDGTSKLLDSVEALEREVPDDRPSASRHRFDGRNAQPEDVRMAEDNEHDENSEWSGFSSSDEDDSDETSEWSGFSASEAEDDHYQTSQRQTLQENGRLNGSNGLIKHEEAKDIEDSPTDGVKTNGSHRALEKGTKGLPTNGVKINGSYNALEVVEETKGVSTNGARTNGSHGAHTITQMNGLSTNGIKINGSRSAHAEATEVKGSFTNGNQPNGSHEIFQDQPNDSQVDVCHIEGRQFPVKVHYVSEPVSDILEASLKTIFQIHYKEPLPGDILVFLTGQESVESLANLVREYSSGMGPEVPKIQVLPLFAALPQAAQQVVFEPFPPGTRKIIISTNIAETSITVPGVRFVIDCGKAKVKHFRTSIGIESLLVKPISKSAAIQRQGRAGREAPGECYRLYTEKDYLALDKSNTPEILRCDLSHPILTIRARGVQDVLNFPFLDQPPREAMEKAMLNLWMLGALSDTSAITSIGSQIARFPLSVSLGRALIAAANPDANCVLEVIDIIACLSVENVFLQPHSEEKRTQAESARRELYKREGDHLTFLATVQAYVAEDSDRKAWAERHFVSHRAMRAVMDVRKQLRAMCLDMGILSRDALDTADENSSTLAISSELSVATLKSILKGFAMNTAALFPDGSYKTTVGKQTVAIHPSSVLFGRKVEAIVFSEFVFTKKSYARGVSAVQMDWVRERFPLE